EIERRPTVGAALLHGAAVGLGGGGARPLEDPVLAPLVHGFVAPHSLARGDVDVVVGTGGEEAKGDRVLGLVAAGSDDGGGTDRQVLEDIPLTRALVPLDLDTVLLPDPVRHDLAAHLGLLVGPGLLH